MFFLTTIKNYIKFLRIPYILKEFVFYSESKYYRNFFSDLIYKLTVDNNKKIIFLTSDIDDLDFFKKNKNIHVLFIGKGFIRSILFATLKCKFMIMTLTDLDNNLKKSINCKKYVYFFHSAASTHVVYTEEAFKNYDIIFCNGNYQIEEIKKTENIYKFKKKELVKTGYFYLDYILKNSNLNKKIDNTILFAPSWNYNSKNLFDEYSYKIIDILLKDGFKVILRPHPEHFKRSNKVISKISKSFIKNSNFILDKKESNLSSMEKSELLITDNSLIAVEYSLVFQRSTLYVNYTDKIHNKNFMDIQSQPLEKDFKKKFGIEINISDIDNISQFCEETIKNKKILDEDIIDFKSKNFYNLGNSSSFAANYLIKYSENLN